MARKRFNLAVTILYNDEVVLATYRLSTVTVILGNERSRKTKMDRPYWNPQTQIEKMIKGL